MAQTPRNVNSDPAVPIGVAGGFEIVLLGVDVWRGAVIVRLACVESAETARLNEEYSATVREREPLIAQRRVPFPTNPAQAIFQRVRLSLRDDVGTAYEWTSGSGSGWNGRTGIDWWRDDHFVPGPPATATALTVSATFEDSGTNEVDLPLT